jgi:ATP-dependent Clp protease ATP-binding subunit ClpB
LDHAVAQSYDHLYGARPLRRWLEHSIITPLSRMIISGELPDDSKVVVDAPDGGAAGLSFSVVPDEAAAAARAAEAARGSSFKKLRLNPGEEDGDEYDEMED